MSSLKEEIEEEKEPLTPFDVQPCTSFDRPPTASPSPLPLTLRGDRGVNISLYRQLHFPLSLTAPAPFKRQVNPTKEAAGEQPQPSAYPRTHTHTHTREGRACEAASPLPRRLTGALCTSVSRPRGPEDTFSQQRRLPERRDSHSSEILIPRAAATF